MARHHEADVHAGESSGAHGEEHGLGGQEVRRLHVDVALCLKQDAHVALHDVGPGRDGAARHHLCQAVVADFPRHRGIILAVCDKCAVDEIPVDEEGAL